MPAPFARQEHLRHQLGRSMGVLGRRRDVRNCLRGDSFFWGELMAGVLLGSVPVALIYSFFVEYFAAGLTAGAVKG